MTAHAAHSSFFTLANGLGPGADETIVFACRDGESTLSRRIVADYAADGSVSPQRFSTSVYNAAPGLWSILTKNRSPYTAVAPSGDSRPITFDALAAFLSGASQDLCGRWLRLRDIP